MQNRSNTRSFAVVDRIVNGAAVLISVGLIAVAYVTALGDFAGIA